MAADSGSLAKARSKLRRAFVAAGTGEASAALAVAFVARGVECLRADDIAPGSLTAELLRHLEEADFVCASAEAGTAPHVLFELGVAHTLGKPIILFTTTYDRLLGGLRGIYVVKATIEELPSVSADIDRFLQNAKPLRPLDERAAEPRQKPNLSWAQNELSTLRTDPTVDQALEFEQLVIEVFRRAGGEIVQEDQSDWDEPPNLIVWLDDVGREIGGPMIIECKYYHGSSGSIFADVKRTVRRLQAYVDSSDAKVGLLIYHNDGPTPPSTWIETPQVLVFSVERVIEALEGGFLAEELLKHRRRASYAKVTAGGAD